MLESYFKIAFRNLKRNPAYTFINVGGLALGLACCVLIALYVRDELSYDDFHAEKDRLVFVGSGTSAKGSGAGGMATPYPLAGALEREVPSVEEAVRMMWPGSGKVSRDGETFAKEENIFHAEDGFFEVFSFPLVRGRAALDEPNTAVLSEELAQKYFPGENPVGQTLHLKDVRGGDQAYRVTGVARSRDNSYLCFGALLSMPSLDYAERYSDQWGAHMFLTFALLEENASQEAFARQATALLQRRYQQTYDKETESALFALPIADLYLSELVTPDGFRGERRYIYLFGAVAFFILLIACVNYVNLATARAAQRAKEVGVRKTLGAGRAQVARQFLGESVLLSMGAFVLSLLLARAALPVFNHLFDKELALYGGGNGAFLLVLFGAALGVGLLAGSYPALYLSGFSPVPVLRRHARGGASDAVLRKGLVVTQFAIAVALIAATGIVFQQLRYTQAKDLGFQKEQVVTVPIWDVQEQHAAIKRAFAQHSGVESASATSGAPGSYRMTYSFSRSGSPSSDEDEESMAAHIVFADPDYLEAMGIPLKAGRFFSAERPADSSAYVLNEAAVRELGWENPVDHPMAYSDGRAPDRVIGVVKDFHFASLREEIGPVVIRLRRPPSEASYASYGEVVVRFRPGQTATVLSHLREQWTRFSDEPLEYEFLDEQFAAMYRTERRLGQVFGAFAFVAVLIACLGLFGLAAFTAEQRTKEIGIRKVLGASVGSIVALLSKDFAKLVLVAFVVAAPVAWWAMSRWLEDFAYRITLSLWLFLAAGAVALLIALLTVSTQALRAATANPTDALRSE